MVEVIMSEAMFPPEHPYHWPVIGYMEDLSAASYEDVVEFFKKYYSTRNASLCIAGAIDVERTKALVEKWFSDVPGGAPVPPMTPAFASLAAETRLLYQDNVQLPRLYMAWHSPPIFRPGDAEMDILASLLTQGRNSRLYKRLVYDLQIAQNVMAYQSSMEMGSTFNIIATARAGHTLAEIERAIQEELDRLKSQAPARRELERAVNQYETAYLSGLESIGGKSDLLNAYYIRTGNPDYFNEDLSRYRALDPEDIRAAVTTFLRDDARLVLSVVPKGSTDLASGQGKEVFPK
jgi:zinc protease